VSRANWPLVLLAIGTLVREGLKPFASEIRCLSGGMTTPRELLENWNERFGRFIKLSFDAKEDAPSEAGHAAQQ
jgi:hypothetical protein